MGYSFSPHAVCAGVDLAHKGEEDGRMPVPDRRIRMPEALLAGGLVPHADQLSACIRDGHPQKFIFKNVLCHDIFFLEKRFICNHYNTGCGGNQGFPGLLADSSRQKPARAGSVVHRLLMKVS